MSRLRVKVKLDKHMAMAIYLPWGAINPLMVPHSDHRSRMWQQVTDLCGLWETQLATPKDLLTEIIQGFEFFAKPGGKLRIRKFK